MKLVYTVGYRLILFLTSWIFDISTHLAGPAVASQHRFGGIARVRGERTFQIKVPKAPNKRVIIRKLPLRSWLSGSKASSRW